MKYCTNDGKKIFDTEEEVLAYEAKIEEEKKQREIEQKEKERKAQAILNAYKALSSEVEDYEKKYGESISGIPRYIKTKYNMNPSMTGIAFPEHFNEFWERLFNI